MPITTALRDRIVDHFLRASAQTSPTTVYLALSSTVPSTDGTGFTEITGATRQAVTFAAPADGVTSNTGDVSFTNSSGSTWSVAAVGVFDDPTTGTLLMYASGLSDSVLDTETYTFSAADLSFSVT